MGLMGDRAIHLELLPKEKPEPVKVPELSVGYRVTDEGYFVRCLVDPDLVVTEIFQ